MQPASKLEVVTELAKHGLSVIPLDPCSKKPSIDWKKYQAQKPSDHENCQWFGPAFADRNIGIVTGAVSGIVVLDIDKPDKFNVWDLPKTPTAKTGKGYHYYFKHPGFPIGNISLPYGDLRGDGGQVVAPPSIHPNGSVYQWVHSFDDTPLADLPLEYIEMARKQHVGGNVFDVPANDNDEVRTTAYGKAWFDDCLILARRKVGDRNTLLNEVACKAGSLIAAYQLNEDEALRAMIDACVSNGLVRDDGMSQVRATIRSGMNAGRCNPRCPPERERFEEVPSQGTLTYQMASAFKAEAVPWLWEPILVKGGLSFLAGEAGQGKSTIVFDIAARITNGDYYPASASECFEQGSVIYLNNEDDPSYTIIPRLTAAGADLDKVCIPTGVTDEKGARTFELRADVQSIERILKEVNDVRLLIIDPFNSYLGKSDINDMGQMRSILNPYAELAQRHRIAVLFVHHFNKGTAGKASNRMVGSAGLRAAARTVYFVERDPTEEDKRILVCDKNNLAKDRLAYSCTIKLMDLGEGVSATYLVWDGETSNRSSDEVLLDSQNAPAQKKAMELIQRLFADSGADKIEAKVIREAAEEAGVGTEVLYKAKQKLGLIVDAHESDNRKKFWRLPK